MKKIEINIKTKGVSTKIHDTNLAPPLHKAFNMYTIILETTIYGIASEQATLSLLPEELVKHAMITDIIPTIPNTASIFAGVHKPLKILVELEITLLIVFTTIYYIYNI